MSPKLTSAKSRVSSVDVEGGGRIRSRVLVHTLKVFC